MIDYSTLTPSFFLAWALWCAAHSLAAFFTTTEPDITPEDVAHRKDQGASFGLMGLFFAVVFYVTL